MSSIKGITRAGTDASGIRETPAERLAREKRTEESSEVEQKRQKPGALPQPSSSIPNVDEYMHVEEPVPIGVYQITKDEEGNLKVLFDDPEQISDKKAEAEKERAEAGEKTEAKTVEECTVNTDQVEAEIKRLKQEKTALEQQIGRLADEPSKQEQLNKKLEQVEKELERKDTETYRRQHAVVS